MNRDIFSLIVKLKQMSVRVGSREVDTEEYVECVCDEVGSSVCREEELY